MPRGWPEGQPPPVPPPLSPESYEEFKKKKFLAYVRLFVYYGPQSPNQKLKITQLRQVYYDPEFERRVYDEDDIRRVMYSVSAYKRSFGILSSEAGGGSSRCVVLELGYNPHDHFYILGNADIRNRFAPVNDEVYRKQFLDGDDSDYNILQYQPVITDTVRQEAAAAAIGDSVANASGGQGDSAVEGGRVDLDAAAAAIGDSVANASRGQRDSAASMEDSDEESFLSLNQPGLEERVDSEIAAAELPLGGPLRPIPIADDDQPGNNSERGSASRIDPGLYADDMDLDDYDGNIDRFGIGTERKKKGATKEQIARMGIRVKVDDCPICMDMIEGMATALPCGHILHNECMRKWMCLDARCPCCKMVLI